MAKYVYIKKITLYIGSRDYKNKATKEEILKMQKQYQQRQKHKEVRLTK